MNNMCTQSQSRIRLKSPSAGKQYLEIKVDRGRFLRDYNALELSVYSGESIDVYETINGFGMAEKQNGERGWVPLKNLKMEVRESK